MKRRLLDLDPDYKFDDKEARLLYGKTYTKTELYKAVLYQMEYEHISDQPLPKDDPFLLPVPSYDLYHYIGKTLALAQSVSMSREECFKKLAEDWIAGRLPHTNKPTNRYIRVEELDHKFCQDPDLDEFPDDDLLAETYYCMQKVTADREEAPTKVAELFKRGTQCWGPDSVNPPGPPERALPYLHGYYVPKRVEDPEAVTPSPKNAGGIRRSRPRPTSVIRTSSG